MSYATLVADGRTHFKCASLYSVHGETLPNALSVLSGVA